MQTNLYLRGGHDDFDCQSEVEEEDGGETEGAIWENGLTCGCSTDDEEKYECWEQCELPNAY
jgi:hypothetical protein